MHWAVTLLCCLATALAALRGRCGLLSAGGIGLALFVAVQATQAWREWRRRRSQTLASGCEPMPCARGRWPGNLDLLLEAQRRADVELPAAYMAQLAESIGSHTFDMRPLGGQAIYTQDPEVIRHILAGNQTNWVKGEFLNDLFADV